MPDLWHLEVANTLVAGERRKRSTQVNTLTWLGFLSSLPIAVDDETNPCVREYAEPRPRSQSFPPTTPPTWNWPCGDVSLATLDDKLRAAAQPMGVPLYGVH